MGTKFCRKKTRNLEVAQGDDIVILACTVLIQYSSVTDRQTGKQTDAQAMAKTREAFCYRA